MKFPIYLISSEYENHKSIIYIIRMKAISEKRKIMCRHRHHHVFFLTKKEKKMSYEKSTFRLQINNTDSIPMLKDERNEKILL